MAKVARPIYLCDRETFNTVVSAIKEFDALGMDCMIAKATIPDHTDYDWETIVAWPVGRPDQIRQILSMDEWRRLQEATTLAQIVAVLEPLTLRIREYNELLPVSQPSFFDTFF